MSELQGVLVSTFEELYVALVRPVKPPLLTVSEAKALDARQTEALHCKHINPAQYHFFRLLGFHDIVVERAEGVHYVDRSGRRILDFFGGFGTMALGHNHPRLLEVRRIHDEEQRHEMDFLLPSRYAAAFSAGLAAIAPGDLDLVFLGSTGSEAVEAALKLAELVQGPERSTVVYTEKSFHGKTRAALSVSDSKKYQASARLLPNRRRVPFGDIAALEAMIRSDRSIGAVILETIQGGAGIVLPPDGYFRQLRALCDQHQVLWIADEIQSGMGRTGRFFAFEHEDVVPDAVVLAKALGGGKTAISAMITRAQHFQKVYGTPQTALIQGPSTFSGWGGPCCIALEALHVLYDDDLIGNAERMGAYLLARLEALKVRYPRLVKEVRGRGLFIGFELADVSQTLPLPLRVLVSGLDERLRGSLSGFVGALLLQRHGVLVGFTDYNRNVLRLEPPLIVDEGHCDQVVAALDDVLSSGLSGIITDYAARFLRSSR